MKPGGLSDYEARVTLGFSGWQRLSGATDMAWGVERAREFAKRWKEL